MGKIESRVQQVPVAAIIPYAQNAKSHSAAQIDKLAASIEEFGFLSPCLIDKDNNLITGHGRLAAAERLGLHEVPCVCVDDLTEAQKRAYIIADNRLTELGSWNEEMLDAELLDLNNLDFNVELTGFTLEINDDWFDTRGRWDASGEGESEEYNEFLEKFEQKKTTDDCYTPDAVYDAVADYVAEFMGYPRDKMIRPFYPGGDYQAQEYPKGYAVVDNPPFSIISEITRYYSEREIPFFLFAPTLTLFTRAQADCCTALPIGVQITYENGACVNTSFISNMYPGLAVKTDPVLYERVYEADKEMLRQIRKKQVKYDYPPEVITAAGLAALSKYGVAHEIKREHVHRVAELDAQKGQTSIYGGGYLLSREATAARLEAETKKQAKAKEEEPPIIWELSERERGIVDSLGGVDNE